MNNSVIVRVITATDCTYTFTSVGFLQPEKVLSHYVQINLREIV